LARKKIDNVRYGYIAHELAPPDFEMHSDPQDHDIAEADRAGKKTPPAASPREEKTPAPVGKTRKRMASPGKEESMLVAITATTGILTESFSIMLQTPGGITITITTGAYK
jgi:hypothetical protein